MTSSDPAAGRASGCTNLSSAELVCAIGRGDRAAEAELCHRYRTSVHRLLFNLCKDHATADDCTNDAMVTVLIKLRTVGIDHPEKLSSYVFQTARYTLIGQLRKHPRMQLQENMDEHETDDKPDITLVREEHRVLVNRAIDTLEVERDREVLFRSYICGEPKATICDALALTTTHFDRVISRARGRLRKAVESELGDAVEALAV